MFLLFTSFNPLLLLFFLLLLLLILFLIYTSPLPDTPTSCPFHSTSLSIPDTLLLFFSCLLSFFSSVSFTASWKMASDWIVFSSLPSTSFFLLSLLFLSPLSFFLSELQIFPFPLLSSLLFTTILFPSFVSFISDSLFLSFFVFLFFSCVFSPCQILFYYSHVFLFLFSASFSFCLFFVYVVFLLLPSPLLLLLFSSHLSTPSFSPLLTISGSSFFHISPFSSLPPLVLFFYTSSSSSSPSLSVLPTSYR